MAAFLGGCNGGLLRFPEGFLCGGIHKLLRCSFSGLNGDSTLFGANRQIGFLLYGNLSFRISVMETACLCCAYCGAPGLGHWFGNWLMIWQWHCGRIPLGCLYLLRKVDLFNLQFLLLSSSSLPDNVLHSHFPCCLLLRSRSRDSHRLLTSANWPLGSARRQSIGTFRGISCGMCLLLLDDTFYCCFSPRFLLCGRMAFGRFRCGNDRIFCERLLMFLWHI